MAFAYSPSISTSPRNGCVHFTITCVAAAAKHLVNVNVAVNNLRGLHGFDSVELGG